MKERKNFAKRKKKKPPKLNMRGIVSLKYFRYIFICRKLYVENMLLLLLVYLSSLGGLSLTQKAQKERKKNNEMKEEM